jgi:hypothetical protein
LVSAWPQLRAGLIALAIFFGLVDGCPIPPPSDTPEGMKWIAEPVRAVQRVVETPVAWIVPVVRASQRWALYQAPGGTRFRMWIEGRDADGAWQILFRAGDPAHDEDAAILEAARVWGAFDPTVGPPEQYGAFCVWMTGRVLARHPELRAVRVRQEKIAFVPGGIEPSGEFVFEYTRSRR